MMRKSKKVSLERPREAGKRASVYTLGCRLNHAEGALIAARLEAAGYELAPFGEPAELGVINTCTVTHEADAKSRKAIRSFIRRNPEAYTVAVGCYPQVNAEALAEIPGVDLVLGNGEKLDVLDYGEFGKDGAARTVCGTLSSEDFTVPAAPCPPAVQRPGLKIQDGCDVRCRFCIVPLARGSARSRVFEDLVSEARLLVKWGAKEIVLTGVNLGAYRQGGKDLVDVVDALNHLDGLARIRISSIEPNAIPESLFPRMSDPAHALTPFLHVPVQSGSDAVLRRMGRPAGVEAMLGALRHASAAVEDLCVGADILVGTPGETETEFEDTVRFFQESPVAYAHVFKYSARKGTAAARMGNKVPPAAIRRRSECVRKLSETKWTGFMEKHLGRKAQVLFERLHNGYWEGYTGNYIRVGARSNEDLTNAIKSVTLEAIREDGMLGSLHERS